MGKQKSYIDWGSVQQVDPTTRVASKIQDFMIASIPKWIFPPAPCVDIAIETRG